MFIVNYFLDSTDNSSEYTALSLVDLEHWLSMNFTALGNRLVVTSIIMV